MPLISCSLLRYSASAAGGFITQQLRCGPVGLAAFAGCAPSALTSDPPHRYCAGPVLEIEVLVKGTTDLRPATDVNVTEVAPPGREVSMADRMRDRTRGLHAEAEATGIVREIISGRIDRPRYVLFMRNLLPVYQQLELGLARKQGQPGIDELYRPELWRSSALAADLRTLGGPDFETAVPLLPAGQRYADRVCVAGGGDGRLLIAHAYTRYLGDLAGGRVLARRLAAAGLDAGDGGGLSFYAFPQRAQPGAFARTYREALDRAAAVLGSTADIVEEAALAFQLNIDLSLAVAEFPLFNTR